MRLIRLILINIKRQLKNPAIMITTLIMPIIMILAMNSNKFNSSSSIDFGIIDNSKSKYSSELIEELKNEYTIQELENTAEDNYDKLRENKLGAIYVIDEDFEDSLSSGTVPKIECYKTESAMGLTVSDSIIEEFVQNLLQEQISTGLSTKYVKAEIIEEENNDEKDEYKMTVLMIIYFMMISSSFISAEILKLKEQKVLKRCISTSNSDSAILGSLFISSFIIQSVLSSIAYITLTLIMNMPIEKITEGILLMFLGSLVTTALITVITRWIKNSQMASLVTVVSSLLLFGLGMICSELDSFENIPSILNSISVISPFTWLLKIINNGEVIMPAIVILLMSFVCFTAGSFRLREYVKE